MNWLSQEEIKRRAEISDEEALNVSIEEWEMKCEAVKKGKEVRTGGRYCGVCVRAGNLTGDSDCSKCCLDSGSDINCCPEYETFINDETLSNAQAMLNRLYLERGKRYGKPEKECKKEKPELRHGEIVQNCPGAPCYLAIEQDPKSDKIDIWGIRPDGKGFINGTVRKTDSYYKSVDQNIFDDLKRNAEDLEEFSRGDLAGNHGGNSFRVVICGSTIDLHTSDRYFALADSEVDAFVQKLNQARATKKRRENAKDC